jgi:hypothetical protein
MMLAAMFAQEVEDGIASGNVDAADIMYLIATILFVIGGAVAWGMAKALWATLVALGLAFVAFGLFLL